MIVDVLGTKYQLIKSNDKTYPFLKDVDGFFDSSVKKCVVDTFVPDYKSKEDLEQYTRQCIRHELLHAFLFESGMSKNSRWASDEEMVDFFAIQFPKIADMFMDAHCFE